MPLRRITPLSFSYEQKEFATQVFASSDLTRIRRARAPNEKWSRQVAAYRDSFLKETLEQLSWVTENDGKHSLNEKEHDTTSAAASLITNILHFAAAAGSSPLEILETAVSSYSSQLGSDAEFRLVWEFLEQLLDIADGKRSIPT